LRVIWRHTSRYLVSQGKSIFREGEINFTGRVAGWRKRGRTDNGLEERCRSMGEELDANLRAVEGMRGENHIERDGVLRTEGVAYRGEGGFATERKG